MWIQLSRAVGLLLTGQPEMLCSVAYRRDWRRFVRAMDALAWRLWREAEHCRARWHHEHD